MLNKSRNKNVNIVIQNIYDQKRNFCIFKSTIDFTKLLKEAIRVDPRIITYIKSYQYQVQKKSLLSPGDYTITMEYQDNIPKDLYQVIIDDGTFSLDEYTRVEHPKHFYIVSKDSESLNKRISSSFEYFSVRYEGLCGYNLIYYSFEELSDYKYNYLSFDYIMPLDKLNSYIRQAQFKADIIARDITKSMRLPPFVKIFLAFSYLQQTCNYDHRSYNNLKRDQNSAKIDCPPHFSYGPLIENRGICSGIAYAFKTLMESLNIECIVITGYLNNDTTLLHAWDLVKVNQQYYHVDPTCGIEQSVCVSNFMKCDKQMMDEYQWDTEKFPKATGKYYNYDFIEDWFIEHGDDLIDAGIDETFVFPKIIE